MSVGETESGETAVERVRYWALDAGYSQGSRGHERGTGRVFKRARVVNVVTEQVVGRLSVSLRAIGPVETHKEAAGSVQDLLDPCLEIRTLTLHRI